MKKFILGLLCASALAFAGAGPVFIWGPGQTAQNLAPMGIYPSAVQGAHYFDDFMTAVTNANIGVSTLGWSNAGNSGGGLTGFAAGSVPLTAYVGHPGTLLFFTGTTNNNTANAFINLTAWNLYAGSEATTTLQWEIQTPAALSSAPSYIMDMGCITGEGSALSPKVGNAMSFRYNAAVSTNWMTEVCNNGTCTETTTADSAHFAVAAGTWLIFKEVIKAGGVSFYMAPAGTTTFTQLGATIATNLPDASDTCHLGIEISKSGTASALSTTFLIDWFQIDSIFASPR